MAFAALASNVEEVQNVNVRDEYINESDAHATEAMHMHRGTARLRLTDSGTVLEGEYYTGRDRKSHGTLRVCCQPSGKNGSKV